jgi:CheY-like chemotaxis protein
MSAPAPAAPLSVLLADDDPSVLPMLSLVLKGAGYAVTAAKDGAEAIAALDAGKHDLLVLDILMPGATGWEVLAHAIAATPAGAPLPRALLITGFHQEYVLDFRLLQEEGVGAMLFKPFPPESFLEEVARVLAAPPRMSLPRTARPASV